MQRLLLKLRREDNSCNQRVTNEPTFKGKGKVCSRHFYQKPPKKMLCLILCVILAPRRGEEKSFWAIKTFVFCSTIALHCSADNKRDFHPKEHNISNQNTTKPKRYSFLSVQCLFSEEVRRRPKWPAILSPQWMFVGSGGRDMRCSGFALGRTLDMSLGVKRNVGSLDTSHFCASHIFLWGHVHVCTIVKIIHSRLKQFEMCLIILQAFTDYVSLL